MTTNRLRPILPGPCRPASDDRGGWFIEHPNGRAGHAFPQVVTDVAGQWFGRRGRQDAQLFGGEAEAVAYVLGCDPADIRFEAAS